MATQAFDVVIAGASFGGVAAALACVRFGKRVALVDSHPNVGGQATAQGLTRWDESAPVITPNTYGSTHTYRLLKDDIRGWYRTYATLAPGVDGQTFNPGFWDAGHPFAADCNVVETVLRQLLIDAGDLVTLIISNGVVGATVNNGAVQNVRLQNGDVLTAVVFVDATDLGELLPMCGAHWVIGAEAHSDTQEPHAEPAASPGHVQPITVSIAVEHRPDGESHTIPRPANYSSQLIAAQAFGVYDGRNGMIGGVFSSASSAHPEYETLFDYRQ